jgi:hypothetical protein
MTGRTLAALAFSSCSATTVYSALVWLVLLP